MPPSRNLGGRPRGTKAQRKKDADREREITLKKAVDDHIEGSSVRIAAQRQGVPTSTVWHRENGRRTRSESHAKFRKLTTIEETELRDWLKELDGWGIHLSHSIIAGRANDILAERGSTDTVGKTWIRKFMRRFPEL